MTHEWSQMCENMTSSTKPEVHNASQRRQRMTEPWLRATYRKFGEVRFCDSRDMRADRQTDKQTYSLQYSTTLSGANTGLQGSIRTVTDAYGDGKQTSESIVEDDDVLQLWRETGRACRSSPARTVSASDVNRVRHHANVAQIRETDDVVFPRIPYFADVKLQIRHTHTHTHTRTNCTTRPLK